MYVHVYPERHAYEYIFLYLNETPIFHLLDVANYLQQYTVNKVFYTCNKILNVSEILELVVAITTIPISVYQATIAAATCICCVNVNGSAIYQLYIGKTWFLTLCKYLLK